MTTEELEKKARALITICDRNGDTRILERAAEILAEPPSVECPWPVRDCEPGYRWVRPGEKLLATDEVVPRIGSIRPLGGSVVVGETPSVTGTTPALCPYGYYRRKVTPKPDTGDTAALLEEIDNLKGKLAAKTHESDSRWKCYMQLREFVGLEPGDHVNEAKTRFDTIKADRDAWAETAAEQATRIRELEKKLEGLNTYTVSFDTVTPKPPGLLDGVTVYHNDDGWWMNGFGEYSRKLSFSDVLSWMIYQNTRKL